MLGTLERHADFPSEFVISRNVEVWLPPQYEVEPERRFPVLYMHDGQNLFEPATSTLGIDWGVDEALVRLTDAGKVPPTIVVGLWSTARRWLEYLPQKPLVGHEQLRASLQEEYGGEIVSDAYLRCLVEEVKPFIDDRYRTLSDRDHTVVMGSSMGGLISLYALCEYPETFAGAGCLSSHWPVVGAGVMVSYLRDHLPRPGTHRVYFDYGTETLDANYEPHQRQVDALMRELGYEEEADWVTLKFPGAGHSERAWRARAEIPLEFLLGDLR
ncbi:MAG: alpha/beta hydrolase [Anaerolineales bacterium]